MYAAALRPDGHHWRAGLGARHQHLPADDEYLRGAGTGRLPVWLYRGAEGKGLESAIGAEFV